jgi:RNA recognition motif-containing protein
VQPCAAPEGEKRTVTKKLYVGNLDYATTQADLSDLFATIGEVLSVNLITDRMTGRSRGFAFVEMAEASAAQQAINELNGKTMGERQIKVAEARPRRPRGQRDSWGGGGRRRH